MIRFEIIPGKKLSHVNICNGNKVDFTSEDVENPYRKVNAFSKHIWTRAKVKDFIKNVWFEVYDGGIISDKKPMKKGVKPTAI